MRRTLLVLAAISLLACSGDSTGPTNASVAGTYTLSTFVGHTLPTINSDQNSVTAGSLVLTTNGAFTFSETVAGVPVTLSGTYAISGSTINFDPTQSGEANAFALIDDIVLTLTAEDAIRVYNKTS